MEALVHARFGVSSLEKYERNRRISHKKGLCTTERGRNTKSTIQSTRCTKKKSEGRLSFCAFCGSYVLLVFRSRPVVQSHKKAQRSRKRCVFCGFLWLIF